MPNVSGILETALYVKDVRAAAEFYRRLFGFKTLLESDRLIALNVADRSVLLLFQAGATDASFTTPGGIIPGHTGVGGGHFAFSITVADFAPWRDQLTAQHVKIESEVQWEGNARSIYFRDPDENLVELITAGFWRIP